MEAALGLTTTIGGLVKMCYDLYCTHKLKDTNRQSAKNLADILRDTQCSLSRSKAAHQRKEHAKILKRVSDNVTLISDYIADVMREVNKKRNVTAFIDAPGIAQNLHNALQLATTCFSRLETVQIAIVQNDVHMQQWSSHIAKFEELTMRVGVNGTVSNAICLLNTGMDTLLPKKTQTIGSSTSAASSADIDDAEENCLQSLASVHEAVRDMVISFARDCIGQEELTKTVDLLISLWNDWHICHDDIRFELRRGTRPVSLGSGGFGTIFAGNLILRDGDCKTEEISVTMKQVTVTDNQFMPEVVREALLQMTLQPLSLALLRSLSSVMGWHDRQDTPRPSRPL